MKILIAGATGLVGSEIVALCQERNIPVSYLTTSKQKIVSRENYQGYYWNPNKGEIDLECFNGVTSIINLAGANIAKRWTPLQKKRILNSRINALRTLANGFQKLESHTIEGFVSASAIGIYPDSIAHYYEEDETEVDDSFLGKVVFAWEKEVDRFKQFNINVAKLRIGLVMSGKGGVLTEMAKPIKYYVGAPMGSGEQWQSWIHIHDLARMFLHVLEENITGVYNAVAPNPVTNVKLTREIAKVLEKPLVLPNIPKLFMRIALGEMAYLLFVSQRVSSKKIEESGFVFDYQNICSALEGIYKEKTKQYKGDACSDREYAP
ncbi:TIGR01777 family protein [Arenibacter sp. 6A1]|uniref:TIGR01777 family oxidoreductase n=1 Tax=Arenibacter sp. 6A1 TaxID=2720391 RepID=UPI001445C555|nr:TIGR01777 family oxidoreductase [Arenibacter sp. 6A1]NKI26234.1 TIGR01777 family protein [Arenibacter sp. 6A1]